MDHLSKIREALATYYSELCLRGIEVPNMSQLFLDATEEIQEVAKLLEQKILSN